MGIRVKHLPSAGAIAGAARAGGREERRRYDLGVEQRAQEMRLRERMQGRQIAAQRAAQQERIRARESEVQRQQQFRQKLEERQAEIKLKENAQQLQLRKAALDYQAGRRSSENAAAYAVYLRKNTNLSNPNFPAKIKREIRQFERSLAEIQARPDWGSADMKRARSETLPKLIAAYQEAADWNAANAPTPQEEYLQSRIIRPETGTEMTPDGKGGYKVVTDPQEELRMKLEAEDAKRKETERQTARDNAMAAQRDYQKAQSTYRNDYMKWLNDIESLALKILDRSGKTETQGDGQKTTTYGKTMEQAREEARRVFAPAKPEPPSMNTYRQLYGLPPEPEPEASPPPAAETPGAEGLVEPPTGTSRGAPPPEIRAWLEEHRGRRLTERDLEGVEALVRHFGGDRERIAEILAAWEITDA